jgi:hypothetical protein
LRPYKHVVSLEVRSEGHGSGSTYAGDGPTLASAIFLLRLDFLIFTTSPSPSYSSHGKNVSTRSYAGPDTLTLSSPPKLSCGFGFWRDFCCFLSLRATAAGESPFSCAASSSGVAVTESPTGRALDDCDGLVCLRLKTTGASSVMTFREVDQSRGSEVVISVFWSIAITIFPQHSLAASTTLRRRCSPYRRSCHGYRKYGGQISKRRCESSAISSKNILTLQWYTSQPPCGL